ncbi:MAG TPA: ABC transporter ATP-binding protein [Bryobacteraceae bacterium]|nr:ABC transporter ATP-binding protein [Bryobacteraceae bacterium]
MNIITLDNVSKVFRLKADRKLLRDHIADRFRDRAANDFYALKNVSFQVSQHESVAIVGANGAGKSTLLSLVVGLTKPDAGRIEVEGRVAALLELGSGFHPDLTGMENIFLNAALLGYGEKQVRNVLGQIIEFAEIGEFIHEPLRSYSSGMIVRLAFSVAVHVDPAILIIDEVLAVGDAAFQEKCRQRIDSLRAEGRTLLCVSHVAGAVREICERAIWLDHGELIMDGPSQEVITAYTDYMNDPHKGLPARTASPAPKVRVMRPGSAKRRATGHSA